MKEHQIVQAGVGRKFQTPSIYDDLTVFENLEISFPRGRTVFGALTFKRDAEVRDRVEEIAEMIFLNDHLDDRAEFLSHGQKQWLEIGMLLIQDPELMMLDEPVAGMSVGERVKTAELLNRISKGRSVIVIEHDMKFVEDIAHTVTVLHQGKILSEATWTMSRTTRRSSKSISGTESEDTPMHAHAESRDLHVAYGQSEVLHGLTSTWRPAKSSPSWAATAWARRR